MGGWTKDSGAIGWGNFERTMGTWERGLEPGPWLLGDRFSAADVMAGSSAYFMRLFGVLPEGSPLNAYADRCLERPAYQRALALDAEGVG
jgi:glutathione S-transferase